MRAKPTKVAEEAGTGLRATNDRGRVLAADDDVRIFFRTSDLAAMLGVKSATVRYWESRFPQLSPTRMPNGTYLYGREDRLLLFEIKRLIHDEGFTVAGARRRLESVRFPFVSTPTPESERSKGSKSGTPGGAKSSESSDSSPPNRSAEKISDESAPSEAAAILLDEIKKELRALRTLLSRPVGEVKS
jgi:DNA-binding transcriptional MerR regulator